jgi:hypothetical protein
VTRFLIDEPEPKSELIALLKHNAMRYSLHEDGSVRVLFSKAGCKWETIFRFAKRAVLVYGVYPFKASEEMAASLSRINTALVRGAFFISDSTLVLRTSAELFDAYAAYESIARAIEYNAGAMVVFWAELNGLSLDARAITPR